MPLSLTDLSNLLDIIRPHVTDEDFPTSLPPMTTKKKADAIETYISTKKSLGLYRRLIDDYLRNSKYINLIRNEFSESYLENYLTKVDIVSKQLNELIVKTDEDFMAYITDIDLDGDMISRIISLLSSNVDTLTAFVTLMKERGISLDEYIIPIQLKLLDYNETTGATICAKNPLQVLGTDHNMASKNMKFDVLETDKSGLWINYRMPQSTSYCVYDLDKAIDTKLSEIKKVKGLNTDLINMTNSIRCTPISTSPSARAAIVDHKDGSILESYDGEHYRVVKPNATDILEGPNPVIDAYNKEIFELVKNSPCANVEAMDRSVKYVSLKQYRGKSVDDICTTATSGTSVKDPEERLLNVLTALDMQKQVYITKNHPDPIMMIRTG